MRSTLFGTTALSLLICLNSSLHAQTLPQPQPGAGNTNGWVKPREASASSSAPASNGWVKPREASQPAAQANPAGDQNDVSYFKRLQSLRAAKKISETEFHKRVFARLRKTLPVDPYREIMFAKILEAATLYDRGALTGQHYAAIWLKAEQDYKATTDAELAQIRARTRQLETEIEAARKRKNYEDAAYLFDLSRNLGQPTSPGNTLGNVGSGTQIYNFNGRTMICSTTGNIMTCN